MIRKECLFHSGLTPSTVPVGRSPMRPFSPARLRPGSLGQRAVPSVARDNPTAGNDVSVTPAFRQTVRAGERGLGVHVPGPPCKPHGGDERAVAAGVCGGRSVRWQVTECGSPGPPPGFAPPLRTPTVGRVLRSPRSDARCSARNAGDLSPRCEQDVFTSRHRGPGRSPVGGCGPVWYVRGDNLQLQTVTDARGAQTPPETVFRARNPGPGAVITALRADTAAGYGVPILCTLATNHKTTPMT